MSHRPEAPSDASAPAEPVGDARAAPEPGGGDPSPGRRPPPRRLAPGAVVGRYVIDEHLGRGGMADVYAARDTTLDRQVALKILRGPGRDEAGRRLLREAKLAARFEHPGSVVVYDVGEAEGVGFIAMELVRGLPLSSFVGDASVPLGRRLRWLVSAARVLAAAHATGLVHRDVKPHNLMIREGGDVKVLDFGIARVSSGAPQSERSSTGGGGFVGTLRYAAPERFAGVVVDGRTDQFSWGITAWELLAGRHPFDEGDAVDAVGKMLLDGAPPLASAAPDLPPEITQAIDRTLARLPEDRFPSLDDVADALEPWAEPPPRAPLRSIPDPGIDTGDLLRRSGLPPPPLLPAVVAPSGSSAPPPARAAGSGRALVVVALAGAALLFSALGLALRPAPPAPLAPPPDRPLVDAIACAPATLDGPADPELARAVGLGACARLAPELGVDWAVPDAAHRLEVHASVRADRAQVTLRLAGREGTGTGASPIPAIWSAIAALTPKVTSPPWPPERVRLWGARDEAAARRIFRVWRLGATQVLPSATSEIVRLLETDGESPIPHLLAVMRAVGGRDVTTARARVHERLGRLPAARADAIRGLLLAFPAEQDRKEAIRLMREAHAAGPDDYAMTSLYATLAGRLGLPEAHALIERLHKQAPGYSLGPLENALMRAAYRDDEKARRYLAWLDELLPEATARLHPVQLLASSDRLAEARAALDLARRLGLDSAADPLFHADAHIHLALAALDPIEARRHTDALLGDPRFYGTLRGALALSASYLQEGRCDEAARVLREQAERQRDQGDAPGALALSLSAARLARWLGRPLDPLHLPLLEGALASPDVPPQPRAEAEVEVALARGGKAVEEALARLSEAAERDARGDLLVRDRTLVVTLPLLRAARGDRAAAALWARTDHAPTLARRAAALDAALAHEALGDPAAAEVAYRLAADASNNAEDAAQRVLALARLGELQRRTGRAGEAAAQGAALDRAWAGADPWLRDAVKRMR